MQEVDPRNPLLSMIEGSSAETVRLGYITNHSMHQKLLTDGAEVARAFVVVSSRLNALGSLDYCPGSRTRHLLLVGSWKRDSTYEESHPCHYQFAFHLTVWPYHRQCLQNIQISCLDCLTTKCYHFYMIKISGQRLR